MHRTRLLCMLLLCMLLGSAALAPGRSSAADAGSAELSISWGLEGHYRVGHFAGLRIDAPEYTEHRLEIETIDGDGSRIVYADPVVAEGEPPAVGPIRWRYLPSGVPGTPIDVRWVDAEGRQVAQRRIRPETGEVVSSRPWVVALGDSLGLERVGSNPLLGRPGTITLSSIDDASRLPDARLGYDGVDALVITAAGAAVLGQASERQVEAIGDWVHTGGRLLVTLGGSGPQLLEQAPWLAEWLPIVPGAPPLRVEPATLETFVSAREALVPFMATPLDETQGRVVVVGRTLDRRTVPLVMELRRGFGTITLVAAALDEAPFDEWTERESLVVGLLPGLIPPSGAPTAARAEARYGEIVGQTRAALDRFEARHEVHFSIIAGALLLLVLLIGPVDYWVVNRWLGRPLLGWITFPLIVVALSAAAALRGRGDHDQLELNQVTLIDIDPAEGVGRGFTWSHLYSGDGGHFDLRCLADGPLAAAAPSAIPLVPFGVPGPEFGGLQIVGEDVRLPAYRFEGRTQGGVPSSLLGMPLAPGSSKALAARWQFQPEVVPTVDLRRRAGSELLIGGLNNPLPVDLLDGFLVYRNTVHLLPTRVPAGAMIRQVESLQQKNFRWRLNRRETGVSMAASQPWNPLMDDSLERLMEIVMFYEAAGGASYTGLENRTLRAWDFSDTLDADRAILVGRVAAPLARMTSANDDHELTERGRRLQLVRVMLPVRLPGD